AAKGGQPSEAFVCGDGRERPGERRLELRERERLVGTRGLARRDLVAEAFVGAAEAKARREQRVRAAGRGLEPVRRLEVAAEIGMQQVLEGHGRCRVHGIPKRARRAKTSATLSSPARLIVCSPTKPAPAGGTMRRSSASAYSKGVSFVTRCRATPAP